jgi:hypothetical protein
MKLSGPIPAEWESKWEEIRRKEEFHLDHCPRNITDVRPLEQRFERILHPTLKKLAPVMQGLIRTRPEGRISIREANVLFRPVFDEYSEIYGNDPRATH